MNNLAHNYKAIGFLALARRESNRILRTWTQTILPPAITMCLYFIVFGSLIGSRISNFSGFPYVQYIMPGLVMMAIITNSYSNVVSSVFLAKFTNSIEEMLVSPMPNHILLLGFIFGGLFRAFLVSLAVIAVSLYFTKLHLAHPFIVILEIFLAACFFSLAGFTNALFAKKFDDIAFVPTFILTPLTYLGGVFFSIHMLPDFWQKLAYLNPILYIVNTVRYGFLGISDVKIGVSIGISALFVVCLYIMNIWLLGRGTGLKT